MRDKNAGRAYALGGGGGGGGEAYLRNTMVCGSPR